MLLAGDIGGTKTVLALFAEESGPHSPLHEATFPSAKYGRLEAIIREFLDTVAYPISHAAFGVAGPVVSGTAQITNLPWKMNSQQLAEAFGWNHVELLNDLEAIAYAVPILEPDDLHTLNVGKPELHGNLAVIAPGTGLGEAFLTWEGKRYRAHASEGGHASFAPTNELEHGLLHYLNHQKGHGHVSFERVCSGGLGIPNLYDYLKDTGKAEEPAWLAAELAAASDPTPIIFRAAQEHSVELAYQTIAMFVNILGAEAGNLALKVLSTAGVYIGGGIPPRIVTDLEQPTFLEAFCHKGRFRPLLADMPVHIILNPKAALLGAAACGFAV